MANQYITADEHLPETVADETVTHLQIRDPETKEIFEARVHVARESDRLDDPEPLSVVRGPHENTTEQWYVEFVDEAVETERLERLADEQRERSNVVNTRSDDLKVLLRYLVETGRYESTSAAVRAILFEHLADRDPAVLEAYDEIRTAYDADPLREALADANHSNAGSDDDEPAVVVTEQETETDRSGAR